MFTSLVGWLNHCPIPTLLQGSAILTCNLKGQRPLCVCVCVLCVGGGGGGGLGER